MSVEKLGVARELISWPISKRPKSNTSFKRSNASRNFFRRQACSPPTTDHSTKEAKIGKRFPRGNVMAVVKNRPMTRTEIEKKVQAARGQRRPIDVRDVEKVDLTALRASELIANSVHFEFVNLTNADLRNGRLNESMMKNCIIERADFTGAQLGMAAFYDVKAARSNFSRAELGLGNFNRSDFCEVAFDHAHLNKSDFYRCNMQGAVLTHVSAPGVGLRECDLTRADLSNGNFCKADFRGSRLDSARLTKVDLSGATLRPCVLDGAQGTGACFDHARFEDSSAKGADLSSASFRNAHLSETSFARAVLRGAALDGAEGDGVEFRGADLGRATLVGARLDEADFRGADLTGADLSQGRFHSADFRGALLTGARFDGADCEGASFDQGEGPAGATSSDQGHAESPLDAAAETVAREGLVALQRLLGAGGGAAAVELLDRLQRAIAQLEAAGDEPPEAWKVWLEPLMRMANGEQPLELQAVLEALSSLAQPRRPGKEG